MNRFLPKYNLAQYFNHKAITVLFNFKCTLLLCYLTKKAFSGKGVSGKLDIKIYSYKYNTIMQTYDADKTRYIC